MSDPWKKSSIQALAAALLAFVAVFGAGSWLLLSHDGAAVSAPAVAYAPVDADSGMPSPALSAPSSLPRSALGASASASPAPLLSDDARDENPGAPGAAPGAAATATASGGTASGAAPKLAVDQHLDTSGSASSSASASASADAPAAKTTVAAAKKRFLAPKLDNAKNQGTIAASVHYGVNSRAELMGRAAGPVYNFSGKGGGPSAGGQVAAANSAPNTAAALQQVDAAQKQLDASDASPSDKARLDADINKVRQDVAPTPAAR
ncbi:MAG: hypothetical protein ACHQ49_07190 [Elusimicrobiota bacterium]